MLPGATVIGCDLTPLLPSPVGLSAVECRKLLLHAQTQATNACLESFFGTGQAPIKLDDGRRDWPSDYLGSISHKKTVVGIAITNSRYAAAIGIDIEYADNSNLLSIKPLNMPKERINTINKNLSPHIVWAVKEAAFKTYKTLHLPQPTISDIHISWQTQDQHEATGKAFIHKAELSIHCTFKNQPWIAAIATKETQ